VKNLDLRITPPAIGRPAQLLAEGILTKALIQLGRALAEGDERATHLSNALEDLGKISYDPRDGELNAALDDVATLARLDAAVMDLTPGDVRQLADEARAADVRGLLSRIPARHEAGAA
jgi:hypothetical protein